MAPQPLKWSRHEQADLDRRDGLICSCCSRPGTWMASKPAHLGGEHLIRHSGRGWPCRVPARDPEVKRALITPWRPSVRALADSGRIRPDGSVVESAGTPR